MTRIVQIRKFFGYTRAQFAKLLNVSRSDVEMWETTSQVPRYETLQKISLIFGISPDFIVGEGIFEHWDEIIKYYDSVEFKFKELIPPGLTMPSFSEKTLRSWLYTRLYHEPDEMQLVRWFQFAVEGIQITPVGKDPEIGWVADVKVQFTPEFLAIMDAHLATEPQAGRIQAYNMGEEISLFLAARSSDGPHPTTGPDTDVEI